VSVEQPQVGQDVGHSSGYEDIGDLEPWSVAEHLARSLRVVAGTQDLVAAVCAEAVRLVPAARDAGIIITGPHRDLETVATTGPVPERLDRLQQQSGSGPCLTAARKQIVVRIHDVATDTRWDRFREAAVQCGVSSMLCLPLYVEDRVLGTLSLYGSEPGSLREGAEPIARLLAALAAIALADARHAEQMRQALQSRDLIGQAKGILMRGHGVTADIAFQMLRTRSQHTNVKLIDVASRVVEIGTLEPGQPGRHPPRPPPLVT
jgi:GAF domain-containing protein